MKQKITFRLLLAVMLMAFCGSGAWAQDVTITKIFSQFQTGGQYKDVENVMGDGLTLHSYGSKCHFTKELRIYGSAGYVISDCLPGNIKSIKMTVTNKSNTLVVSGGNAYDPNGTWTEIGSQAVPGTVTYDFTTKTEKYKAFKIGVTGSAQIRIKDITIVYEKPVATEVPAPAFSIDGTAITGDSYEFVEGSTVNLTLTAPEGATSVMYKMDGAAEQTYSAPIQINKECSVEAWAINGALTPVHKTVNFAIKGLAQNISFAQPTYTAYLGETFAAPAVADAMTKVTYAGNNDKVATIDPSTGAVTLVGLGEVTVTATAEAGIGTDGKRYSAGTAEYTLTVKEGPVNSIADLKKSTANKVYTLRNSVTVNYVHGNDYYVSDASGALLISGLTTQYKAGDVIPGGFSGKFVKDGSIPQLKGSLSNFQTATETATVTPEDMTGKTLTTDDLSKFIVLRNVTYVRNNYINDGTNDIYYYKKLGVDVPHDSKKYTVNALVSYYSNKVQVWPTEVIAKKEQTLSFGETKEYTVFMDEVSKFVAPKVTGNETKVTYSSSAQEVATVNAETGEVSILGMGTTTITATAEETETVAGATATYTIIVSKREQGMAFPEVTEPYTVAWGEKFEAPALTFVHKVSEPTYSVAPENIVEINPATGEIVKLLGLGTATITATAKGNEIYNDATASYELTVTKTLQQIHFDVTEVTAYIGTEFKAPTLHQDKVMEGAKVVYSIDNTAYLIDEATGDVVFDQVGTATVTATVAGDANHETATASYTLNVKNFAEPQFVSSYQMSEIFVNDVKTLEAAGLDLKGIHIASEGTAGTKSTYYDPELRIYTGNDFSVTSNNGNPLTKVVLKITSEKYKGFTCTVDGVDATASCEVDDPNNPTMITWTGNTTGKVAFKTDTKNKGRLYVVAVDAEFDAYPLTIGKAGYSTFAAHKAYTLPQGLQGGVVTVAGDVATVTYKYQGGDVVPAEEALVIKGVKGEVNTYAMPYATATTEKTVENQLKGAFVPGVITATSNHKLYVFASKGGQLGFYFQKGCPDGSQVSNIAFKAYLDVDKSTVPAGVNGFRLVENDATGIEDLETVESQETVIYTISGVRVNADRNSLPKGLYIINGKKVLVK